MTRLLVGLVLVLVSTCTGYEVFHSEHANGRYQMGYWDAHRLCASQGAHLATRGELEALRRICGWTLDKAAYYPMARDDPHCGGRAGLHHCTWKKHWDAYCFRGDAVGNCSRALGIENGDVHHSQLYASSEDGFLFRWKASIARLHNSDLVNAWIPRNDGRNQWFEVDLNRPTAVTGILTQGASRRLMKMWVVSFKIAYSKDGRHYKEFEKVFSGNVNNNGIKRNMFPEPALARYIRFIPHVYHNHIALRLELLGCDLETYQRGVNHGRNSVTVVPGDPFAEFPPEDEK